MGFAVFQQIKPVGVRLLAVAVCDFGYTDLCLQAIESALIISLHAPGLMGNRCSVLVSVALALSLHGLCLRLGIPLSPVLSGQHPQLLQRLTLELR